QGNPAAPQLKKMGFLEKITSSPKLPSSDEELVSKIKTGEIEIRPETLRLLTPEQIKLLRNQSELVGQGALKEKLEWLQNVEDIRTVTAIANAGSREARQALLEFSSGKTVHGS